MQGYLSADITCSGMLTVLKEWSSRKTVSSEEQWCSRTNIQVYFHAKWRLSSLLLFRYFCNVWIKFLQTIYCLLCGMFNFQCSKVWLGKQTNISLLWSHLQSNFKQILVIQLSQLCAGRNIWWIILTDTTLTTKVTYFVFIPYFALFRL